MNRYMFKLEPAQCKPFTQSRKGNINRLWPKVDQILENENMPGMVFLSLVRLKFLNVGRIRCRAPFSTCLAVIFLP